jgi:hypothetical protein
VTITALEQSAAKIIIRILGSEVKKSLEKMHNGELCRLLTLGM